MSRRLSLFIVALLVSIGCRATEAPPQHKFGASSDVGTLNQLTQPTNTAAITPNDGTDVTALCTKGAWVGTAGDLAVKALRDSAATTLKNVPSGSFVPGQFIRVMATNTTATNIVCFGNE